MTLPTKVNGSKAKPDKFGEACPRDDVSAPAGKDVVWRAYDKRTGAYLGVVVTDQHTKAKTRASELYAVPLEHVHVPSLGKVA